MIYFDIETGPLPEDQLVALMPPFDPGEVKTGNIKDPDKIAAKIAEAKANHKRQFLEDAALDPITGRVVAIGVWSDEGFHVIGHDDEAQILREFWELARGRMGYPERIGGFNVCGFDLPFLFRRSWKHRLQIPIGIRRGRYWSEQVIDLREVWQMGDRNARGSLDAVAKHLGVGAKNGDGKQFAELWQTDRPKAVDYLRNDLMLTARVAEALGCAA
jgi:predicted PolB exonuclease-like 3'-5' exonuclease